MKKKRKKNSIQIGEHDFSMHNRCKQDSNVKRSNYYFWIMQISERCDVAVCINRRCVICGNQTPINDEKESYFVRATVTVLFIAYKTLFLRSGKEQELGRSHQTVEIV